MGFVLPIIIFVSYLSNVSATTSISGAQLADDNFASDVLDKNDNELGTTDWLLLIGAGIIGFPIAMAALNLVAWVMGVSLITAFMWSTSCGDMHLRRSAFTGRCE